MSIDLTQCFKMAGIGRHAELHVLVQDLREQIRPLAKNYLKRTFVEDAVRELDRRACGFDARGTNPASTAYQLMLQRQQTIKEKRFRHPRYDASFSLSFIPGEGNVLFGRGFTEVPEWFTLWMARTGADEFDYWDNSDRPDHLTEDQWAERKDTWHSLFPQPAVQSFSTIGFSYEISDVGHPPLPEDLADGGVAQFVPGIEARAGELAMLTMSAQTPVSSVSEAMHLMDAFTPSGARREAFVAERSRLVAMLDPSPTLAALGVRAC